MLTVYLLSVYADVYIQSQGRNGYLTDGLRYNDICFADAYAYIGAIRVLRSLYRLSDCKELERPESTLYFPSESP